MDLEVRAYWSAAGNYRVVLESDAHKIIMSQLSDSHFYVQHYVKEDFLDVNNYSATFKTFYEARMMFEVLKLKILKELKPAV